MEGVKTSICAAPSPKQDGGFSLDVLVCNCITSSLSSLVIHTIASNNLSLMAEDSTNIRSHKWWIADEPAEAFGEGELEG